VLTHLSLPPSLPPCLPSMRTAILATLAALAPTASAFVSGPLDENLLLKMGERYSTGEVPEAQRRVVVDYTAKVHASLVAFTDNHNSTQSRHRRTAPVSYPSYTTCSTCIAANYLWNGVGCVQTAAINSAFLGIGCFWGSGHGTDCNADCSITWTMQSGCKANSAANPSDACTGAIGMEQLALKLLMKSTIGADNNWNGPQDSGSLQGYYFYPEAYANVNVLFNMFEMRMRKFTFLSGYSNVNDGPKAAHMDMMFAIIPRGTFAGFASVGPGGSVARIIRGIVVADAYYFYDTSVCPNGVTASGSSTCGAQSLLTQSNTFTMNAGTFDFVSASSTYTDTAVAQGSDTTLRNWTFCATAGNPAATKLTRACFKITALYATNSLFSGQASSLSGSVSAAYSGTYTCGSFSETMTLFDDKIDAIFSGIQFDGANTNERIGFRIISTSQTGGLSFSETESSDADMETFTNGPLKLELSKNLMVNTNGASDQQDATCAMSYQPNCVKAQGGYRLSVVGAVGSGATTSCGYTSWFTAAVETQLAGMGLTNFACTYGSFSTTGQEAYVLWDPTVATDENNAVRSANAAGTTDSSSASSVAPALAVLSTLALVASAFLL